MTHFTHNGTLSAHAAVRTSQRSLLAPATILEFLKHGAALDIGNEPGFNRKHWLLYSTIDKAYFVAVTDYLHDLLITLLPLEYHANLAWQVSPEQQVIAQRLMEAYLARKSLNPVVTPSLKFIVSATYHSDTSGAAIKTKTLFSAPQADFNYDLATFMKSPAFFDSLDAATVRKGVLPARVVDIHVVQARDNATPLRTIITL